MCSFFIRPINLEMIYFDMCTGKDEQIDFRNWEKFINTVPYNEELINSINIY